VKPPQSAPYSALIFPLQASTKDLIPKSTTIMPLPWFHKQPINQPTTKLLQHGLQNSTLRLQTSQIAQVLPLALL
jgi:hypothetical protein